MSNTAKKQITTQQIVLIGMMAAMAFVSNYIRIPLGESKVHVGNAVCALNGLLFGPWAGFAASGIGNFLYDLMTGYGAESLITLVSKGAISTVTALVAGKLMKLNQLDVKAQVHLVVGCVLGALTYVALYMLKTFLFGLYVNGLGMDATLIKMGAKLPASMINAVFAAVAAPILFNALYPALKAIGLAGTKAKNSSK